MTPVAINYLAVLVSAICSIVLGGIWYGPLFGKKWAKLMGINMPANPTKEMKSAMMQSYAIMGVTTIIMAFVMAHSLTFAMEYTKTYGLMGGLMAGFWNWLGFILPVTMGDQLWGGKSWKLLPITAGYYLVSLLLMGSILAVWR